VVRTRRGSRVGVAYWLRKNSPLGKEPGKKANFVVLDKDPSENIRNTRTISAVWKNGHGFYGWPYSYFGQTKDPVQGEKRPDLVGRAIVPDYALGSHTASLGLAFYNGSSFPERYRGGAFVGQRGSWNRSRFSGYKVVFVPFRNGKPAGPPEDFLTGFMANPQTGEAHGRKRFGFSIPF
jgi:glucose/arabinose dehydrogenase